MKLRNKKTGEIVIFSEGIVDLNQIGCKNVAEMMEAGWEDVPEEPKEHWIINAISGIETTDRDEEDEPGRAMIEIGNYFDTREAAEKAVERLRAWKRLRDKGFRFNDWHTRLKNGVTIYARYDEGDGIVDDLNMLFGSEE